MKDETILLVDDNPDDRLLTRRALRKSGIGHKVVVARDGAEALDYLLGSDGNAEQGIDGVPQLVLLDVKLPKVDGLEVLRRLRADERTRCLAIVIMTSCNREQDGIDVYGSQADRCITRHVDFAQFSRAVGQLKPLLAEHTPVRVPEHAA